MKHILSPEETKVTELFQHFSDETIVLSCLQNVMGAVYANENETSAAAYLGSFCFFAGVPDAVFIKELLSALSRQDGVPDILILVPQDHDWCCVLEKTFGDRLTKQTRYAICKEGCSIFDRNRLENAVKSLPDGYTLENIDVALYHRCLENAWSMDFVAQFSSAADFCSRGLGVVCLYNGELAAGASSYSVYHGGIEIEIGTRTDHRRKGLAFACASALILRCLDAGLYPSWDAANLESVALAEKLGYHRASSYPVYYVRRL